MSTTTPPSTDRLALEYIQTALADWPIGHTLDYHVCVASTMPIAHRLVTAAPTPAQRSGTVVVAEVQTAGRGRLQRRWETPRGRALLSSVIVAGSHLPVEPAQLPMIGGLAVMGAIESTCPPLAEQLWLKWPNDVLLAGPGGEMGKMAGILVESAFQERAVHYAVLGMGINVNQRSSELPPTRPGAAAATSLYSRLGQEVDRNQLLVALCQELSHLLVPPGRPTVDELHDRWRARLHTLGQRVTVRAIDLPDSASVTGRVVDTTVTGGLVLEDSAGRHQLIQVGDVENRWTTLSDG